jgi:branched-chain amino acid transport system ATP-binding protein
MSAVPFASTPAGGPAMIAAAAPAADAAPDALALSGITMNISGLIALSEVSFAVPRGRIVSLIGPNGAGKTTAFNVISGYMRPTSGKVTLFGEDVTAMAPERIAQKGLVRTFQRTSVFNACSVTDNVLTALHLQGTSGVAGILWRSHKSRAEEEALRAKAAGIIDFVKLTARADELASSLSYGEQRLLGVGIAMAARPQLLLLDEPAAGLNPSESDAFKELIRAIRNQGTTVLLVEHDMHVVMSISDHIIVLNHGQVIATGAPHEIQHNPEVIRAYLGSGMKRAKEEHAAG